MFVAGTDTTAATLEWTMTELVRHPKVMKKAQEEVGTRRSCHKKEIFSCSCPNNQQEVPIQGKLIAPSPMYILL